jgi:hypothetical protein
VFLVRYGLDSYILFRKNSVFKGLNIHLRTCRHVSPGGRTLDLFIIENSNFGNL